MANANWYVTYERSTLLTGSKSTFTMTVPAKNQAHAEAQAKDEFNRRMDKDPRGRFDYRILYSRDY